jgi:tetratricopeptide (TPR) repeat protein
MPQGADLPPALRSRGFGAGGSICYWQAAYPQSHNYYATALEAARETGEQIEVARALYNLSFAPVPDVPDNRATLLTASIPMLEEAAQLFEQLNDVQGIADTNWGLGFALLSERRFDDAERHSNRAYEIALQLDDPFRIGWNGHIVGSHLAYRGKLDEAEQVFRRSLDKFRASGDQGGIILMLLDFGLLAELRGDLSRYWRLAGAMYALREKSGIGSADITFFDVGIEFFWKLPSEPTAGDDVAAFEAGKRMNAEQAIAYALEKPAKAVAS